MDFIKKTIGIMLVFAAFFGSISSVAVQADDQVFVAPDIPKIKVRASNEGKLTVKIGKTKDADGYEIFYAFEDSIGFSKLAVIKKNGKKQRVFSTTDLDSGNYFVKARAYVIDSNGTKHFGKCCPEERVKIRSKENHIITKCSLSEELKKQVKNRILYKELEKTEKEFYLRSYAAMLELQQEVPIEDLCLSKESIHKVFWYILSECPEVFWVDDARIEWTENVFRMFFTNTKEEVIDRMASMEEKAINLVDRAIRYNIKPIDQVINLNMFVAESRYEAGFDGIRDMSGSDDVIIDGRGICVGFARAFSYLCKKAGYNCLMVSGSLEGIYDHAFNLVQIKDKWYLVEPQEIPSEYEEDGVIHSMYSWTKLSNDHMYTKYQLEDIFDIETIRPVGMLTDIMREECDDPTSSKHWKEGPLTQGEYEYCILDDGTAFLLSYLGNDETVVVPNEINGIPVSWFYEGTYFKGVRKIVLNNAINFSSVRHLVMEDWIEEICVPDDNPYLKVIDGVLYSKDGTVLLGAFCNPGKKELVIPEGVKEIKMLNCPYNHFERVVIPGSVSEIKGSLNIQCDELILSEGIKVLGESLLDCCYIYDLFLPSTLTYSGTGFGFRSYVGRIHLNEGNQYYCLINGNLCSKDGKKLIGISKAVKLLYAPYQYEFHIPDGVIEVYDLPAYGQYDGIYDYKLFIPSSVVHIDEDVFFTNCPSCIEVAEDNQTYICVDNALYTKDMKRLVYHLRERNEEYAVPDGVEQIGTRAFCSDKKIKKIVLPKSIKSIEGFAFAWTNACVVIPEEVNESIVKNGCNAFWQAGSDAVIKCTASSCMKLEDYASIRGIKLEPVTEADFILSEPLSSEEIYTEREEMPAGYGPIFDEHGAMRSFLYPDGRVIEYDEQGRVIK